ncbi:hypothetical protein LQW54_011266 [Pestalotiopsis sp. IQ-011]
MAPIFANMSCDPFTAATAQCVVGAYVQYAVNASSIEDYQTTLAFARTHNIRLVVRNTGHDYFGKSTGAGAIALWTHNLKDISFLDYGSSTYQGKAMKIGAGVQNVEAQTAAHTQGLVVVGGDCQSVGIAGGYTQGGGHGPLASKLGLGADQVLEWELVTTTGEHLTASPTENPDLYWALSGGGGGTYGLVFSLTVRAYPDFQTAMANLTFSKNVSDPEPFYQAVETFVTTLPAITDAGATAIWLLTSTTFSLSPMTGPGMTSEQLQALLQPTLDHLDTLGVPYDHATADSPTYLDSYHLHPQYTITEANIGGRLIPRSIVDSSNSTAGLMNAMKFITSNNGAENGLFSAVSVNVTSLPSTPNSVNPVWRSVLFNAVIGLPYDTLDITTNVAAQDTVTTLFVPKLAELTPNGAAYINEGDYNQPDFQQVFYGTNYQRLLDIKHKYDPEDILYARTAVGSDAWETEPDGRLCRV